MFFNSFNYSNPFFNLTPPLFNYGGFLQGNCCNFLYNFFNPIGSSYDFLSMNYSSPLNTTNYGFTPPNYNFINTNYNCYMNNYNAPMFQANFNSFNFPKIDWSNCFTLSNNSNSNSKSSSSAHKITPTSTSSVNNSYSSLSPSAAWDKALSDSRLERLSSGSHYTVANTFYFKGKNTGYTDIPFARKGTSEILEKVGKELNITLNVTSALATGGAGNPHVKGGAKSHHNADNPKLDFAIPSGMSSSEFAQKLKNTGYFSHILNEGDHIDVQIAENTYKKFETVA